MNRIITNRFTRLFILLATLLLLLSSCKSMVSSDKQRTNVTGDSTGNKQHVKKKLNDTISSEKVDIKHYQSKGTVDYTWPDIYKNFIVFANHPSVKNQSQTINLVDTNNNSEKIIYSTKGNIDDVKIYDSWIYWLEGESLNRWAIMAYNIKSNKSIKVRESINKQYTLIPRINNDSKEIFWFEGYRDKNQSLHHEIYMYDPDKNKIEQLATINYVDNPYQILIPRNDHLCFADKVDGRWIIRTIDIKSRTETKIKCKTMPIRPVCDGNIVIWTEGDLGDNFYLFDIANGKKTVIDHRVDYADIINDCIVYTKGFQLYKYYTKLNKFICLSERLKNNNENLTMWFSCYKNIIVLKKDISPGNSEIAIVIDKNKY